MRLYQENEVAVNEVINRIDPQVLAEKACGGLLKLSLELGMTYLSQLMEADVTALVGEKGKHDGTRTAYRHGHEDSCVVMGGQKMPVRRPRMRSKEGEELPIPSLNLFQNEDPLREAVLARLLSGVSTRKYAGTVDSLGTEAKGVSKSEINRIFIEEMQRLMEEFFNRPISDDYITIMIDGLVMGEITVVAALGITTDGRKRMLGLIEGGSENSVVVNTLLCDLINRGLKADRPRLFVLDGGKALHKAVSDTFGDYAVFQRCQIHKERNVISCLPQTKQEEVAKSMFEAYNEQDYEAAKAKLLTLAEELRKYPSAANSLLEGLDETLTVTRLNITGKLRQSLCTTNALESANAGARRVTRNLTRVADGATALRQAAAGFIETERHFNRITGFAQLPKLDAALSRLVDERLKKDKLA